MTLPQMDALDLRVEGSRDRRQGNVHEHWYDELVSCPSGSSLPDDVRAACTLSGQNHDQGVTPKHPLVKHASRRIVAGLDALGREEDGNTGQT